MGFCRVVQRGYHGVRRLRWLGHSTNWHAAYPWGMVSGGMGGHRRVANGGHNDLCGRHYRQTYAQGVAAHGDDHRDPGGRVHVVSGCA